MHGPGRKAWQALKGAWGRKALKGRDMEGGRWVLNVCI